MPYTQLQLILCVGLSSVLFGYLHEEILESGLVHFFGLSSTGKTTALFLALSCACKPSRSGSLMTQWNSTFNALYAFATGNYGMPIAIDELSGGDKKDMSDFIYNLINGTDKDRMTSSLELREKGSWATTIISSGETSILSRCNKNSGLNIRVMDIQLPHITENAAHAEILNDELKKNYGHANIKMAEYLVEQNHDDVVSLFEEQRKMIQDAFKEKDKFTDRISKKLAVFMLSAVIGEKVLGLKFDLQGIRDLLIHSAINQSERMPKNLLENTIQVITEHLITKPKTYSHYYEHSKEWLDSQLESVGHIKHLNSEIVLGDEKVKAEICYNPQKLKEIFESAKI